MLYKFHELESLLIDKEFNSFLDINEKVVEVQNAACVYRSETCRSCKYWDLCSGGCPLYWAAYNPDDYIKELEY